LPIAPPLQGHAAGGSTFDIVGLGTVLKNVIAPDRRSRTIVLQNVIHAPSLTANLISISRLDRVGLTMEIGGGSIVFLDKDRIPLMQGIIGPWQHLYEIQLFPPQASHISSSQLPSPDLAAVFGSIAIAQLVGAADAATWHRRLGHIGDDGLLRSHKLVTGMTVQGDIKSDGLCQDCIFGKHSRRPFTQCIEPEREPLERVYIDVWGPSQVASPGGHRYFLSIDDGGSSWSQPYFMSDKTADNTLLAFQDFHRQAERLTGRKLKHVRMDNGGEFANAKWEDYFRRHGILHEFTAPYTPEQNGVAERSHRTLVEHARCMLKDAGLPSKWWAEAVATAAYLKNLSASRRHPGHTPHEIWTGQRPDVSHLRVFGCRAYKKVPDEMRQKFDDKSTACIFLGYYPGRC
jgi:Integrase core domain/GAG-pre-integrase domain